MEGVEFPHTGRFLFGKAAKTRCSSGGPTLQDSCLVLPASTPPIVSSCVSSWATIAQSSFLVNMESEKEGNNSEDEASRKDASETSLSAATTGEPSASTSGESISTLLPKALSAVLQHTMTPGHSTDHPTSEHSATHTSPPSKMEQLQAELTVLRGQFEQMKAQHNKEIKLLMNELDEEKRIRLTLQMEIKRIKKHMSK